LSELTELFTKYQRARKKKNELEQEIALLKAAIQKQLGPNETREGVYREVRETRSVSYAKALPEIKALVPKTRQPEIEKILERNSTVSKRESIKEA
jgi:hypothetical protein